MRVIDWLRHLTVQERVFAAIAAFSVAVAVGVLAANLAGPDVKWGDIGSVGGALVAAVAFIVAVPTYLDNRRAQRLEHRAYLNVHFDKIDVWMARYFELHFTVENYGRTPARSIVVEAQVKVRLDVEIANIELGRFTSVKNFPETHPGKGAVRAMVLGGIPEPLPGGQYIASVEANVTYADVFNESHSSQFQVFYVPVDLSKYDTTQGF